MRLNHAAVGVRHEGKAPLVCWQIEYVTNVTKDYRQAAER